MRGCSPSVLFALACIALAGCDDGGPAQQLQDCPANYQTCQGAGDCVSGCACEGTELAACMQQCGGNGGPYVGELDQSAWSSDWEDFEADVLERTNAARAKGGCCGDEGCFPPSDPLALDERLRSAARSHAFDMGEQDYFDHESKDGRSPFDRMREAGFRGCTMGENIASGQPTPASVMDGWLNSPGHCAHILQPRFKRIGIGFYEAGSDPDWVQNFGG
jgi:uncharacterized protein YkwD